MAGVALLFPGQGNQRATMLPWLDAEPAAQPMLQAMARALSEPAWRRRAEVDPAWLRANGVAQVLVTATTLAALAVLAPSVPRIVCVAGYSVGELASHVAAGVIEPATAVTLATIRAAAMDRAALESPGGLLSIADVDLSTLDRQLVGTPLSVAIRLGPTRGIVGGPRDALDMLAERLAREGASVRRLAVDIASHTPWMAPAAVDFARALRDVAFVAPRIALVSGVEGAVLRDPDDLRDALARQLDTPLQWDACLQAVAERRPDRVLELGGGSALATMWRQAHPDVPARSTDEFASAADVSDWLRS